MEWKNVDRDLVERDAEESRLRREIVKEALTWIGTPYHENGDVKRAGVDCGMILIRVYQKVGLVDPSFDPRPYPIQWAFNQRAERYLSIVEKFAGEIAGPPLPGDVVLFKVGHCWAHGGIVTSWPDIIHANPPSACREDSCTRNLGLSKRTPRFFSVWAK